MGAAEKLDPHGLLSEEEHQFKRYKRSAVVHDVKPLALVSNKWSAGAILSQWLIITGAWAFAAMTGEWWAYIIGGLVIGSRQIAFPFLMHESVHGLLFTNKTLNHYLSEIFVSFPINVSTAAYREFHLNHHRHLGTPKDPELALATWYDDWMNFPKPKREIAVILFKDLLMLNTPYLIRLTRPISAIDRMLSKHVTVGERLAFIAFWIGIATLLTVTGQWLNFLLLWVIPFFDRQLDCIPDPIFS